MDRKLEMKKSPNLKKESWEGKPKVNNQGKKSLNLKRDRREKTGRGNGHQMPVERRLAGSRDPVSLRSSSIELSRENLALQR